MAQATRTVGPGTYVRDANAPVLVATGNVAADTDGSWIQVDRPDDVTVEMILGAIGGSVTGFDVEIVGSDTGSGAGTSLVSYGRFGSILPADASSTWTLSAHVYKPYIRAEMDYTGSGNVNVGIKMHTAHNRVSDSTTAGTP